MNSSQGTLWAQLLGKVLGNQDVWQTEKKKKYRKIERHTKQMKQSKRIGRDAMRYKREQKTRCMALKNQRARKKYKRKRHRPRGTEKRRQWLREDRTGQRK